MLTRDRERLSPGDPASLVIKCEGQRKLNIRKLRNTQVLWIIIPLSVRTRSSIVSDNRSNILHNIFCITRYTSLSTLYVTGLFCSNLSDKLLVEEAISSTLAILYSFKVFDSLPEGHESAWHARSHPRQTRSGLSHAL